MKTRIDKEILRLAVPNILSNISVPLLSTVDTILMGGLSSIHLAAVGISSMIFNIVYWNFGFLRMGTTGMTAQYYGADNNEQVWLSLLRAGLLALLIAVTLILSQSFLFDLGAWALNVSSTAGPLVQEYFQIRIWAAPASLLLMVIMGWFFGLQNALYPLYLTVLINVVNIIVSYILVKHMGFDVAGVAWGTLIAQYIGAVAAIMLVFYKYKQYIFEGVSSHLQKISAYSRFLKVNLDLFLRTICLTFVFGFFYSQSSKISDTVLAVNVVLMQFVNWMSYGIDGFAYATESLIGRYKGARDEERQKLVISRSFIMGGLVSILYAGIYWIFDQELFYLFTDDKDLWDVADELMPFMIAFPLAGFASYIWDGVFVGLTSTKSMRNAMIFSLIVFLIAYYLQPLTSNGRHIWIAMLVFMVMRALFQWMYYRRDGLQMG